jgi:fructose-1,6-bisphosphatase/inositol monophosphatase family enzyme
MGEIVIRDFLPVIKRLHERIRDAVVESCEQTSIESLSSVAREDEGDTIYSVDEISEELVVDFFENEIATRTSVVLIAEGIENGKIVLPRGTSETDAKWRIILDPIDGTRGLMFQKRSAWILTGVARNRGDLTSLADIEFAIQTEIPLVKQHMSDTLWAFRGGGFIAERFDRIRAETREIELRPSGNSSIAHGFASISRFIPGVGPAAGEIYENVVRAVLGEVRPGKAQCFEDQYISTGGQIYELIAGHDRFVADLRPLFEAEGTPTGLCCHPYDLCTELIAREAGVIVTDEKGEQLTAPLAVEPDVAWIGYANQAIRAQIEPHLMREITARSPE